MDLDILQDYLAEARELLERAQEDVLALENNPSDSNVLASLFRAFHTLKGGAGFLEAGTLVDFCHRLEDLLDKARSKAVTVTPAFVDVVLQGVDVIHGMLDILQEGEMPAPGPRALLDRVAALASGVPLGKESPVPARILPAEDAGPASRPGVPPLFAQRITSADRGEDIFVRPDTDVRDVHGPVGENASDVLDSAQTDNAAADEISEDEFEHLLDTLYGAGKGPGMARAAPVGSAAEPPKGPPDVGTGQPGLAKEVKEDTIRVEAERLDSLVNEVGEIVLLRNRLLSVAARSAEGAGGVAAEWVEALSRLAAEMDVIVNDLQENAMRLRMQACRRLFHSLPRVVRDTCKNLGKQASLVIEGEDVEIDKTVVDALSGPLVHLVRNALDHGLEAPEERIASGKSPKGFLRVAAIHGGDKVRIEVTDDGRGMEPRKILESALKKALINQEEASRLDEKAMLDLIFRPGFSTKTTVSEISGRGVGMDVVREAVKKLRGQIEIRSVPGKGTTVTLELPLMLAVLPVLYFRLNREDYALPISLVHGLVELDPARLHQVGSSLVYRVGDELTPIIDLGRLLHGLPMAVAKSEGVLTEHGLFLVSEVVGTEDSVIKPMDFVDERALYQGTTISAEGKVVLILNPPMVAEGYGTVKAGAQP